MWNIGHQSGSEKASLLHLPLYFLQQELDIGEQDPGSAKLCNFLVVFWKRLCFVVNESVLVNLVF